MSKSKVIETTAHDGLMYCSTIQRATGDRVGLPRFAIRGLGTLLARGDGKGFAEHLRALADAAEEMEAEAAS